MSKLYGNYGPVSQPWERVGKAFSKLTNPRFKPLQTLVEQILKSPYSGAGLQAVKSVHDLLLGMNTSVMDEPCLRIHYDFDEEQFVLAYPSNDFQAPTKGAKWVRKVSSPNEAFAVLERFLIKGARWFRAPQK